MKTSKEQMIDQTVKDYIEEMDYDNALPREVGMDKEGNYYFYLDGIITEDPDGDWDYDEYATGDVPYFKLLLNENGQYEKIEKICELNSQQSFLVRNDQRYLFGSGGVVDLVEKYKPDSEREFEQVSSKFLAMVINEREPIGKFYSGNKEAGYVAVDNSEGEAWTEEFAHFETLERWMVDPTFEYYTETDFEKYAELDSRSVNDNKLVDLEM